MKVLCECWRKSDTCIACYMANLEDWNQIHAIAMSAEAQRRLEEDLRFLESINVWHLVNLRSNPSPALYGYGDGLDVISPAAQHGAQYSYQNHHHPQYHQQSHHHHPNAAPMYLGNQYLPSATAVTATAVANINNQNNMHQLSSSGYGTSLPYPDLIIHAREISSGVPPAPYFPSKPTELNHNMKTNLTVNGIKIEDVKKSPPILKKNYISKDENFSSSVIQNNNALTVNDNSNNRRLSWPPQEPDDYDAEETITSDVDAITLSDDPKKSVKFTPETIFVERDMESPFWKAFTERRRLRRINRQRKQLNAQIATASYQPSLVEIVKSAFSRSSPTKDTNGNCTRRKQSKGEVLVYDNSSQIPESYTAQYVYTTPTTKRSSKLIKMLTCQCCTASPSC